MPDYRVGRLKGRFVLTFQDGEGKRRRYRLDAENACEAHRVAPAIYADLTRPVGRTVAELWEAYVREKVGRPADPRRCASPLLGPAVLVTGREGSCDARGARGAQVLGMRAHPGCPVRATLADWNRCPGVLGGLLRDPPTLPWPTRTGGGGRRAAVGRGLRRHLQGGVPRDEPPARPSRPRDGSDPHGSRPGTR